MSTPFPIVPNNAVSALAANYTAGSGVMSVNPGDGAKYGTPTPERPVYITVVSQNTNLFTIFRCTGRSTDLLTGLVAIDSTSDRNYVVGDPIRVAVVGQHFEDLYTAVTAIEDSGAVLPSQTGNTGKVLTTDGSTASWAAFVGLPTQTGQSGKYLTTNGTAASWVTLASVLPAQTGNTGKYLTTDGTSASWATIASTLPTQTGNNGKYLTTDGTTASWVTLASTLPTQTGNNGKYLTTDGTTASWVTLTSTLPTQTGNSGKFLATDGTNPTWTTLTADTLLPSQTSNAGKVLTTDGTNASWATPNAGTVTSVAIAVPSHLTVSGSPVTGAGTLTLGLALQNANTGFFGPTTGSPAAPTFRSMVAADVPNLDATKITSGTLAVAQGGTGQATASAAINALVPTQTGNSGKYLSTNGTAVSWTTVTATGGLTQTPAADADNTVVPTSASVTPLRLECASSQTAPLLSFLDASGVTTTKFTPAGYMGFNAAGTYPIHMRMATWQAVAMYLDGSNGSGGYTGLQFTPSDGDTMGTIQSLGGNFKLMTAGTVLRLMTTAQDSFFDVSRTIGSSGISHAAQVRANVNSSVSGTAGFNVFTVNLQGDSSTGSGNKRLVSHQLVNVEKSGVDILARHFLLAVTTDPADTPNVCSMCFNTANNKLWIYNPTGTPGWKSVTLA